jgi:uncharacterized cupredoxin-like copper-binding protein
VRGLRWFVVAGLAVLPAACGSSAPPSKDRAVVDVYERDFVVTAPHRLAAGDVTLRIHNQGPDDHELLMVRATARLPMRHDGLTVDEDAVERTTVLALEPAEPRTTRLLSVHLEPGRYELFCNMSGHFMGGMHEVVVVR